MTALPDNTWIIWAHPWLTQDLLEHVGNHRLVSGSDQRICMTFMPRNKAIKAFI